MSRLNRIIKIFGAALDPNDDPLKIISKHAYIKRKAQKLLDTNEDFLDPYEGLIKFSRALKNDKFEKIGKFPIESWLRPKPEIEDLPKLNPVDFQEFTNSGKIYEYALKLEDFIKKNILPDIPLMIGTDHSLTGGVLKALSEKFEPENVVVVIFDAHLDSLSAQISLELSKYASENRDKVKLLNPEQFEEIDMNDINLKDSYTCASFLNCLIQERTILPENVIIFGNQDYPSEELLAETDPRAKKYVEYYLSFEKKGVQIIPASDNEDQMITKLKHALEKVRASNIYISLDVDVCMFKEVLAARFTNAIGIEKKVVISAAKIIKNFIEQNHRSLVGMDIMEMETYVLNKELKKSGRKDRTIEVIDEFLEALL